MNEIDKLYENAGFIKTKGNCDVCPLDVRTCKRGYSECPYIYPPFTAEKQLELIKLIANRKGYPAYEYFGNWFDDYIQLREFDEALARLVNNLWQDLTEQEKEQIRDILVMK